MSTLTTVFERRCFGGVQGVYSHVSRETGTAMRLAIYRPPQAEHGPVPTLTFLSGLTCTELNFTEKAGAQRWAAEHGLMLVAPDTSPRGLDLPGEHDHWDFGSGAGFYLDATEAPWSAHYRMYSYVTKELPELVDANFPSRADARGLSGHSMGGHGALVIGLRNPGLYRSVSAFSPIVAPSRVPWGEKAFTSYLGPDRAKWRAWDATALVEDGSRTLDLLVDQGTKDEFLAGQLVPDVFRDACARVGQPLELRMQDGYDHSYYFIATFIADHVRWHAARLAQP
jgi:S-formylglutathione hydrolase